MKYREREKRNHKGLGEQKSDIVLLWESVLALKKVLDSFFRSIFLILFSGLRYRILLDLKYIFTA